MNDVQLKNHIRKLPSFENLSRDDLLWILNQVFGNVFVCDSEGKILFCNQHAADAFGLTIEKTLSMNTRDIVGSSIINRSTTIEALESKHTVIGNFTSMIGMEFFAISTPLLNDQGDVELVVTYSQEKSLMSNFAEELAKETNAKEKYKGALSYFLNTTNDRSEIVAQSPQMMKTLDMADRIAKTDSTVLILGDTGSGKDVMANYIHSHSFRKSEPFIPVNCSSIPSELIESEFFGYEKGAFTGANVDGKLGLFEMANKGTLFLDEIGELPLSMQPKLLRVLETGEFLRVGGTKTVETNVRLIVATNRDLKKMVENKQFRDDLYYRINIIPIELPPLRERKEDIIPMAVRFLDNLNQKYSFKKYFSRDTLSFFREYNWPGNVRELKNLIESMVITSDGDELKANSAYFKTLPTPSQEIPDLTLSKVFDSYAPDMSTTTSDSNFNITDKYKALEKERVLKALLECNGNKSKTAKMLGISPGKLYRILGK